MLVPYRQTVCAVRMEGWPCLCYIGRQFVLCIWKVGHECAIYTYWYVCCAEFCACISLFVCCVVLRVRVCGGMWMSVYICVFIFLHRWNWHGLVSLTFALVVQVWFPWRATFVAGCQAPGGRTCGDHHPHHRLDWTETGAGVSGQLIRAGFSKIASVPCYLAVSPLSFHVDVASELNVLVDWV